MAELSDAVLTLPCSSRQSPTMFSHCVEPKNNSRFRENITRTACQELPATAASFPERAGENGPFFGVCNSIAHSAGSAMEMKSDNWVQKWIKQTSPRLLKPPPVLNRTVFEELGWWCASDEGKLATQRSSKLTGCRSVSAVSKRLCSHGRSFVWS